MSPLYILSILKIGVEKSLSIEYNKKVRTLPDNVKAYAY